MGCCSLKTQKEDYSKIERMLRLSFFVILHTFFLNLVYLKSVFNKNYKKVYIFYKTFYKKAYRELKEN